ncbi:hypothetical protein LOK49_LG13G00724 [Camellia lanceoleosa]|uniref:Uncharacterized protein n=1 Tax=Camellia lanceoleosa TaxID=1840588 RepID=A0ACC0FJZ9_9ERIC|nr:hypothetical protein LOK49_LG13G00724 [Camellia lanceoleosa]
MLVYCVPCGSDRVLHLLMQLLVYVFFQPIKRLHGHLMFGDACIHVSQEDVPDAEARAQKEDLVLWPPVIIIHNSSIAENNVGERKVITLEALGEFLRGKGFSGGKIKTYLGKPANHSVRVVKFLGTFSGLQDAERLHKYFVDNKHGRVEFEQVTLSSSKGKSSSNNDVGVMQGHSMEELVLYGYIGIAEDLDKVDMDTKRKSLIKSKEIQDLANAAVKPE